MRKHNRSEVTKRDLLAIVSCLEQRVEELENEIAPLHKNFSSIIGRRRKNIHHALLPEAIEKAGLSGPHLTAQVAYPKGNGPWSCARVQRYLRGVLGLAEVLGEACVQFITTPDIEPANHLAQGATRFFVMDRRITQGTRGQRGRPWCERVRTAGATQNRSACEFILSAVKAGFNGHEAPSLAPVSR